jgi:hypothetical protein
METYFYWCGVTVNAVGAFGAVGLVGWWSLEMWVRFRGIRKPLLHWYWETYLPRNKEPRP